MIYFNVCVFEAADLVDFTDPEEIRTKIFRYCGMEETSSLNLDEVNFSNENT